MKVRRVSARARSNVKGPAGGRLTLMEMNSMVISAVVRSAGYRLPRWPTNLRLDLLSHLPSHLLLGSSQGSMRSVEAWPSGTKPQRRPEVAIPAQ